MNTLLRINKNPLRITLLSVVFVFAVVATAFFSAPKADAVWAPSGPTQGGGGTGHWTMNGFGWKFYSKSGGGPNNGFSDGTSWGNVVSACSAYSGSGVWIHVVRNSRGDERSYNYEGASWNPNRPAAGSDPYDYDENGNYSPQGSSHQQHVINIVATMQSRFSVEHSAYLSHWGVDVGWFCDGRLENWSSSGTTSVNMSSALPGDTIQWTHTLSNDGPTGSSNIYSQTVNGGFADGNFNGVKNGTNGALDNGSTRSHPSYSTYTVQQADVGSTLCQQLQWDPTNSTGGRDGRAANACVSIPYRYSLVPSITNITDGNVVESSDSVQSVIGSIHNNGPTKSRPNVNWRITQLEYNGPLSSIPKKGGVSDVSQDPCSYFSEALDCDSSGTTTPEVGFPGSPTFNTNGDLNNKPAGRKICFVMSVQPFNDSTSNWSHSEMKCLVIGKKPKVQVLSGDLLVGRASPTNPLRMSDVNTSASSTGGRYYGSWGEYAIVPSGCVTGMASGSGYSKGAPSNLFSNLSLLSFTKIDSGTCATNVGRYVHTSSTPNVAARFPINVPAGGASTPSPAVLPSTDVKVSDLTGQYQAPGGAMAIRVTGGADIPKGRQVVINAPGATVTIADNIRYTNEALANLTDIPQVIIIARNIIIADNVTQIDSWLVAVGSGTQGVINTCGIGAVGLTETSPLTVTTCVNPLVVNGPVITNHLVLRRTAGSDGANRGQPAEVFNLRPDSYLWATGYNLSSGRISTAQTKELPPRY